MEHGALAELGAALGAAGCLLALLAYDRKPTLAGLVALAAGEAALGLALLGSSTIERLASPLGAVAAAFGLLTVAAGAFLLSRKPALVAPLALVAAPLRPPLDFGPDHPLLVAVARDGRIGRLLPLYLLLACAALAFAWRLTRGGEAPPLPRPLARPLAVFTALVCLSLFWAADPEAAANHLAFFTIPFATLLCIVGRTPAARSLPKTAAIVAVAVTGVFAAIGIWQFATHRLFFYAPNLALSNANTDLFRVTSLFGDPSLYGRHLVLGLCVLLTAVACARLSALRALPLVALLWVGLLFSFSQTSMVSLLVGTLVIAVLLGGRRLRLAAAAIALAAVLVASSYAAFQVANGESVDRVSSDRLGRLERTLDAAAERPLVGVGIASQPRVSKRLAHSDRPTASFASHTAPAAVLAELGVVGLALFIAACAGVWRTLRRLRLRHEPLAIGVASCLVALFVHSLGYSNLIEDPLTWLLVAIPCSWLALPDREARRRERELRRRPAVVGGRL